MTDEVQGSHSQSASRVLLLLFDVTSLFVIVLTAAMLAANLSLGLGRILGAAAPSVGALAFFVALLGPLRLPFVGSVQTKGLGKHVLVGAFFALALIDYRTVDEVGVALKAAAFFFVPAAVEEVVFRHHLLQRFAALVGTTSCNERTRLLLAAFLAALAFSASHYVLLRSPFDSGATLNLFRLFALALTMTLLVRLAGVGIAIGAHTAFNTFSVRGLPWSEVEPSVLTIGLTITGAFVALYGVGPIRRKCDEEEQVHLSER